MEPRLLILSLTILTLHMLRSAHGLQCYFCVMQDECVDEHCSRAKNILFDPSDPAAYIGRELLEFGHIPPCPQNPNNWPASRFKRECGVSEVCGHYKYDFVIDVTKYVDPIISHVVPVITGPVSSVSPNGSNVVPVITGPVSSVSPNSTTITVIIGHNVYKSSVHLYGCVPRRPRTSSKIACESLAKYSEKNETVVQDGNGSASATEVKSELRKYINNETTCCQCENDFCNRDCTTSTDNGHGSKGSSATCHIASILVMLYSIGTVALMKLHPNF